MNKILTLALGLLVMVSCMHPKEETIALEDFTGLDTRTSFVPFRIDYGGEYQIPAISDEELRDTRATGLDMSTMFKNLVANHYATDVVSYVGSYWSTDQNGDSIKVSGRIVLPANGKVKRLMIMCHYTIVANSEAPSMNLPFESMLAAEGIGMIEPDYIGYGITADRIHPYLMADLTAKTCTDMYYASLPFLKHIGRMPEHDDIYIYGFSQGGSTAVCTLRSFEYDHPETKVRLVFAGGGPYDVCATYDTMVEKNEVSIPYAVPLIIQGMNVGHGLGLDYKDYFKPILLDNFEDWLNSKRYQNTQVTALLGTNKLSDILTEETMNKRSPGMSGLYRAMLANSIVADMLWEPEAPIYLFHSMDDDTVPYVNAIRFMERYRTYGNITVNVGHYGSHVMAALRFIYTAKQYLKDHGEI